MTDAVLQFLIENAWPIGFYAILLIALELLRRGKMSIGLSNRALVLPLIAFVGPSLFLAFYYATDLAVVLAGGLIAWFVGTIAPDIYDRSWRELSMKLPFGGIALAVLWIGDPVWLRLKLWLIGLSFAFAWTGFVGRVVF